MIASRSAKYWYSVATGTFARAATAPVVSASKSSRTTICSAASRIPSTRSRLRRLTGMRRGWEEVALDGIAEAQYNMNLTHIQVCSIPLVDQSARTVPVDAPWEAPNAAVWDGQALQTWPDAVKAHARGFASSRLASLS